MRAVAELYTWNDALCDVVAVDHVSLRAGLAFLQCWVVFWGAVWAFCACSVFGVEDYSAFWAFVTGSCCNVVQWLVLWAFLASVVQENWRTQWAFLAGVCL